MTTAFEVSHRFVDEVAARSPVVATMLGIPGNDHEWGDSFSLAGVEDSAVMLRGFRSEFEPFLDDPDPRQRLTAQVTIGSIDERLASFEGGDHFRDLRHLGSMFHQLARTFDMMPTNTRESWDAITSRLETIDGAYRDYQDRLDEGRKRGITVSRRQVRSVIEQSRHLAGDGSAYLDLVGKAGEFGDDRLVRAADHARAAAGEFGDWLESVYLPEAVEADGVGEEAYRREASRLVGLAVDPHEAYRWGWEELNRLFAELARVGDRIVPGTDVAGVRHHLESDASGLAHTRQELVDYVSGLLEGAVSDLAGRHFEVPDVIRPLTVQVAPPGGPLGAYYTPPSEDFSRPGGVWYSIGDRTSFPLYQHVSTAYHEGFPGHHLQVATSRYRKDDLGRAHRMMTWYPGYGEGWAMYAEVLMGELGYLEEPSHYFGMLTKQAYRAARVVVDIGLHLGLRIDESSSVAPGEPWTFESAVSFMEAYGFRGPAEAEAEVLRYLGWPGQAIAYKLGEREILSIRQETRDRLGGSFDLKQFHATVLNNGAMRLDLLREVVAERL